MLLTKNVINFLSSIFEESISAFVGERKERTSEAKGKYVIVAKNLRDASSNVFQKYL